MPNLQVYFKRHWKSLALTQDVTQYQAGDVVTVILPGNLPHIMLVSDAKASGLISKSDEPLVIHNIGRGAKEETALFRFKITGHYRMPKL